MPIGDNRSGSGNQAGRSSGCEFINYLCRDKYCHWGGNDHRRWSYDSRYGFSSANKRGRLGN
nr:hypothetical protein [uncultured bacterium]